MNSSLIKDRERPFDPHDHALFAVVELQGKRMVDDAAAHATLFDGEAPSSFATLKIPGSHFGHPGIGPS